MQNTLETISAEDKAFFEEMDYFDTYGKTFGAQSRWSIYDEGIKMGNEHPFGDNVKIRHKCDIYDYDVTVPVKGSKWGDVWVAADKAIVQSEDLHHIFIEGFEKNSNGELELHTGS
jgi:hypothetical protein